MNGITLSRDWWLTSDGRLSAKLEIVAGIFGVSGVLFLCRGLLFGVGGYALYVDPALPASNVLLRGICNNGLTLWSSVNLGQRVLYPSEFLACAGIKAGLAVGVPAWAISRLLPIVALCIGAVGMVKLLSALPLKRTPEELRRIGLVKSIVVLSAISLLYACSAFSFNELVAGHFLYLIALASFPWAAWIVLTSKHDVAAVVLAGVLLSISYVQIQFVLIAPLSFLALALIASSGKVARRAGFASAFGFIPHLSWAIPLLVYPPKVDVASYLLPGTETKFGINPLDGLRLVGYVTRFAELALSDWYSIWWVFSLGVVALACLGLMRLSSRRGAVLVAAVGSVLYYEWGANAPGYSIWSSIIPWPIQALLRERYALSFVVLFALTLLTYLGSLTLLRFGRREGVISVAIAMAFGVAPFLDGHLGPFGTIRERFATAAALTNYINDHGGGAVLTVPFGSIVKGQGWAYFGRSPFSLGGPVSVLDTEGPPNAPALPIVQALARTLNTKVGFESGVAETYLRLLRVRYVVEWQDLIGDVPIDRSAVHANLDKLGAQRLWSNGKGTLWAFPDAGTSAFQEGRALYVSGQVYPRIFADAARWEAPLTLSRSDNANEIVVAAEHSNGVVHFNKRNVRVIRQGRSLTVIEPVLLARGGKLIKGAETYVGKVPPSQALAFGDASEIPVGSSVEMIDGPLEQIYPGDVQIAVIPDGLLSAAHGIQDTDNVRGLSLAVAGISARPISQRGAELSVMISAARDQAGLPIALAVHPKAEYGISLQSKYMGGSRARAVIVADGATKLLEEILPVDSDWSTTRLKFGAPAGARSLYLYIYVDGSVDGSYTSTTALRQVRGTATRVLGSEPISSIAGSSLATSGDDTLDYPAQQPQQILAFQPDLSLAVENLQNTANAEGLTLAQAGIDARVTQQSRVGQEITVRALRDQAGVPVSLPIIGRASYSASFYSRHVAGPEAHFAVVINGERRILDQPLTMSSGRHRTEIHFAAPAETRDLYLYLYVGNPSTPGLAEEVLSELSVNIVQGFPDVVIVADESHLCGPLVTQCPIGQDRYFRWLGTYYGQDPWWRPKQTAFESRVPLSAYGYGQSWFPAPRHGDSLTWIYLPDELFRKLIPWLLGATGLTLLGALLMSRISTMRILVGAAARDRHRRLLAVEMKEPPSRWQESVGAPTGQESSRG